MVASVSVGLATLKAMLDVNEIGRRNGGIDVIYDSGIIGSIDPKDPLIFVDSPGYIDPDRLYHIPWQLRKRSTPSQIESGAIRPR